MQVTNTLEAAGCVQIKGFTKKKLVLETENMAGNRVDYTKPLPGGGRGRGGEVITQVMTRGRLYRVQTLTG